MRGGAVDFLERTDGPRYLFGAGSWGQNIIHTWPDGWLGILDNDESKWGTQLDGLDIMSPEVVRNSDALVFIASRLYYNEIKNQLTKMGLNSEAIVNVGEEVDCLAAKQYFDLDALTHVQEETFVDVGSLDGKTAAAFADWSGLWHHIYLFEPDSKNVIKCENRIASLGSGKCTIIPKGAWSSVGERSFQSFGNGSSALVENEGEKVSVTTLDQEVLGRGVTFIKMDIEGAELEAIKGAKQIISKEKPKLAICIYHKPEDVFTIPALIAEYNPSYKFYLRHYSLADTETVLYAI